MKIGMINGSPKYKDSCSGQMLEELSGLITEGNGPKKSLGVAFAALANTLKHVGSAETILINPNFPRVAYILAAHQSWNQQAKRNGMKKKELFKQL